MKLSTCLIGAPVVAAAVVLAVANRQTVTVSLDPFYVTEPSPALSLRMPLFLALFAAVGVGSILGGVAALWSRRRRAPVDKNP